VTRLSDWLSRFAPFSNADQAVSFLSPIRLHTHDTFTFSRQHQPGIPMKPCSFLHKLAPCLALILTLASTAVSRAPGFVASRTSGVSPVGIEFPCQETGETPVLLEPVECPDSQILTLGGIHPTPSESSSQSTEPLRTQASSGSGRCRLNKGRDGHPPDLRNTPPTTYLDI
jgi:hypothetical protein